MKQFVNGRYISACESAWRIFKFPIQGHDPVVYRLSIHLPGQHQVTFQEYNQITSNNNNNNNSNNNNIRINNNITNNNQINDLNNNNINNNISNNNIDDYPHLNEIQLDENSLARRLEIQRTLNRNLDTTLMAYFKLNDLDPSARQYKYTEIPKHYYFDRKLRTWIPRQIPRPNTVGRIYYVNSKDSERFALRLLLNHVSGAKSFQELLTHNNIQYPTFQAAAIARDLIADSNEAILILEEAYNQITNAQRFRQFFVHFIINIPNLQINVLWEHFKNQLSEDFLFHLRENQNNPTLQFSQNINYFGLIEIYNLLNLDGYNMTQFPGLPQLSQQQIRDLNNLYSNNLQFIYSNNVTQEYSANILNTNLPLLNDDQRLIFNTITHPLPHGNYSILNDFFILFSLLLFLKIFQNFFTLMDQEVQEKRSFTTLFWLILELIIRAR